MKKSLDLLCHFSEQGLHSEDSWMKILFTDIVIFSKGSVTSKIQNF